MMTRSRASERVARVATMALENGRVPWVLGALFIVVAMAFIVRGTFLHDEGQLTFLFSYWLARAPLPILFFQKVKAVTGLLYALPASVGERTFEVAHVLVAAAGVTMLGRVAHALGIRSANFAALVLAASPIYFGGAITGFSNTDGAAFEVLFLELLVVQKRPLAAGIVLGALPWVRFELLPLVGIFAIFGLVSREHRRLVVGLFVFPALYLLLGAMYHRDLAWMAHFPPTLSAPMPGNPAWVRQHAMHGVSSVTLGLLGVTPLILIAAMMRPEKLTPVERAGAIFVLIYLALVQIMPAFELMNFGFSPRYSLQALPFLALLSARAVDELRTPPGWTRAQVPVLIIAALLVEWGLRRGVGVYPLAVLWCCTAAITLARAGAGNAATLLLSATALIAPFRAPPIEGTRQETAPYLDQVAAWLRAHQNQIDHRPIYTNAPLLAPFLQRDPTLRGTTIRFVMERDQLYELDGLSNPRNGQRAALRELARRPPIGESVLPDDFRPETVPVGSLFVLRPDARIQSLISSAVWQNGLHPVGVVNGIRIFEWAGPS